MNTRVLVMNFGSTSTKLAVYKDGVEISKDSIQHEPEDLSQFDHTMDQKSFRKNAVFKWVTDNGYTFEQFSAVISRGGNCRPIPGGIYEISKAMIDDIYTGNYGVHPAGLGCVLAREFGSSYQIPALTAYPPITDEFCDLARFSGIKELHRISSFHALNHKAIAKRHCEQNNLDYNEENFVVVHLGGGISIASHEKGKMIDANNALDGDGPFAPERSGSLPVGDLVKMCFSGAYTQKEILKKITGGGGLMSYLGTSSALEIESRINSGDTYAKEVYDAMAYQVAKAIGGAATALKGSVNSILLTGSIAHSDYFTGVLSEYVGYIAPIHIYAGENEMLSLAENAFRYLNKTESPLPY